MTRHAVFAYVLAVDSEGVNQYVGMATHAGIPEVSPGTKVIYAIVEAETPEDAARIATEMWHAVYWPHHPQVWRPVTPTRKVRP